ncbi:hypothetical protein [Demequina globuliformis]|uniref:hypothetical protein n=1 Tax=Demequina globuliformis TaxID=676202 RepID=UPI000784B16B|nr:hypothetical protein [Demequina globuliformis]
MAAFWSTLGALALVSVGLVLLVAHLNDSRTAQAAAQEYFEALATGDATKANTLTRDMDVMDERYQLLTDEALGAATELISDIEVEFHEDALDPYDSQSEVSYTLAGERHTVHIHMSRGEPDWWFLDTWLMPDPFAFQGHATSSGWQTFSVAGLPTQTLGYTPLLYPAVYPIEPSEPDYVTLAEDELAVDGEANEGTATFSPTAALIAEVQAQVNARLDDCVTSTSVAEVDEGCPMHALIDQHTKGTWHILEYPAVELSRGASWYSAFGGRAQFVPEDGAPMDALRPIKLEGYVHIADGMVTI